MDYKSVRQALREKKDEERAAHSQRFFKTGKGEYGEGDKFLGLRVPDQRSIAKKHKSLPLDQVEPLLYSDYHEDRLTALLILTYKFEKADEQEQQLIHDFYLKHIQQVNNWDLVDSSAHKILGAFLEERDRSVLYQLAQSPNLWKRRVAMISCKHFIDRQDFEDALNIAELLVNDDHDLIHKAVGWMLREIGKLEMDTEEEFLKKHYVEMPRTMLRYAIEKFPEERRQAYLNGTI